jgi:hypothetical protein
MCCLKRPFDNPADPRVAVEALAFAAILEAIQNGEHEIVVSDAHRVENAANPHPD